MGYSLSRDPSPRLPHWLSTPQTRSRPIKTEGEVLLLEAELRMERAQSEAERAARMKAETKEETRARLDREAAEQAEQLKRSVADGLAQANKKQKTTETAFQRGGMMDELLGDISDMSSSDDEE